MIASLGDARWWRFSISPDREPATAMCEPGGACPPLTGASNLAPVAGGTSAPGETGERALSRRTVIAVLGGAAVVGIGAAVALRGSGSSRGDSVATFPDPRLPVEEPGIPTNPELGGESLPADMELVSLDGDRVRVGSLIGAPLVINFWNSSCTPCKVEMPDITTVSAALQGRVRIVGANTLDTAETARAFADKVGARFELYVGAADFADRLRLSRLPTTVFVTPAGRITSIQSGAMTAAELRERIDKELL